MVAGARFVLAIIVAYMVELTARMQQLEVGMVRTSTTAAAAKQRAQRAEQGLQQALARLQEATQQLQASLNPAVAQRPVAVAPPPPFGLVDTRSLGRPRNFDGRKTSWCGYRFGIMAYAGALEPRLAAMMGGTQTTAAETSFLNTPLSSDEARLSA